MSAVLDRAAGRDPPDGLGRGRRRDRAGRRRQTPGDRADARRPAARPARLPGARIRLRHGPRGPPEGGRGDRQGPGRDDARQRRRPGRDQPAGDRARDRRRRGRGRAARLPRRQGHPRRLRPASPSRAGGAARSRRGGSGRPRGPRGGPHLHQARRHDRLHGQRRRPGDDHDGPGQAGRRRAGQLPRHRRRGAADRVAAAMRIILADPKVNAILVNIFRRDHPRRRGGPRPDRGPGRPGARRADDRPDRRDQRRRGAALLEQANFTTAATLDEAATKAVAASRAAGSAA